MKPSRYLIGAAGVTLALSACSGSGAPAAAAIHAPNQSQASPLPANILLSGSVIGQVSQVRPALCGRPASASGGAPAMYQAEVDFNLQGTDYKLLIVVPGYKAPGTFELSPQEPLSVTVSRYDRLPPTIYFGQTATVIVNPDGLSGSVAAKLARINASTIAPTSGPSPAPPPVANTDRIAAPVADSLKLVGKWRCG